MANLMLSNPYLDITVKVDSEVWYDDTITLLKSWIRRAGSEQPSSQPVTALQVSNPLTANIIVRILSMSGWNWGGLAQASLNHRRTTIAKGIQSALQQLEYQQQTFSGCDWYWALRAELGRVLEQRTNNFEGFWDRLRVPVILAPNSSQDMVSSRERLSLDAIGTNISVQGRAGLHHVIELLCSQHGGGIPRLSPTNEVTYHPHPRVYRKFMSLVEVSLPLLCRVFLFSQ